MEQAGLKRRDLIPFIGSRAKVSEILSGRRAITMPMARALHEHLGIPAGVLLRRAEETPVDESAKIEWTRFPLRALAKRGWIPNVPDPAAHAEELVRGLIARAGGARATPAALYRRTDNLRANAKTDPYALRAWCWQALATAAETRPSVGCAPGAVTVDFLRQVARLSCSADGPKRAREFLNRNGIPLVIVEHLPKTCLDGAAHGSRRGVLRRCHRDDFPHPCPSRSRWSSASPRHASSAARTSGGATRRLDESLRHRK